MYGDWIPEKYPMADVSMILGNLTSCLVFTKSFERSSDKPFFSVNGGKYDFKRLPFPGIFQRALITFSESKSAMLTSMT